MNRKYLFELMAIMMVTLLSIGFVSCGSNNDEPESPNQIVGLWEETAYWKDGEWKSSSYLNYIFEFKADNTYKTYLSEEQYKEGKTLVTGTYTFDGKTLSLDGGFKHNVVFSENGQSMRIEEYFTFRKYK